ncbi:MAG: DUF3524 domain-containing protein [Saprospiraceae bacterium]|nr:DUF3524 domain-containing protein [Saprospiraceae bacterium]
MATIAAFEGFYGGSHRQWLDQLAQHSAHQFRLFTLPDRFWKWRMHGGAVTLADQFLRSGLRPDLILATDMIDLNVLLGLIRSRVSGVPVALYMHENQLTYPWSATDPDPDAGRDHHYGFINYTSALAADQVWFNSTYHMASFLEALPAFLRMFPDHQNQETVAAIRHKSIVVPLGIDLRSLDTAPIPDRAGVPAILWNHRWEFDKQPDTFFKVLFKLADAGHPFQLIVLGTKGEKYPPVFDAARERLHDHIVHWGPVNTRTEYAAWLGRADLLPVTAIQDFFGISVVEAMYCDVYPLLPDRLAYPEHVPGQYRAAHLYTDEHDLLKRLSQLLSEGIPNTPVRDWVRHYDWQHQVDHYDTLFSRLVA